MMKLRNKEQAMRNYYEVQSRKLEIESQCKLNGEVELKEKEVELNALARAKEAELKLLSEENSIITADLATMPLDGWFEKRQK
jgi:uncharacterized protein YfeS